MNDSRGSVWTNYTTNCPHFSNTLNDEHPLYDFNINAVYDANNDGYSGMTNDWYIKSVKVFDSEGSLKHSVVYRDETIYDVVEDTPYTTQHYEEGVLTIYAMSNDTETLNVVF